MTTTSRFRLIALLLLMSGMASATHMHVWMKESYTYVYNQWNQRVMQCTWSCRGDMNNVHYAVTTGMSDSMCPMPN